ncbi:hypothetical protein EVAR_85224_1 [Eumeta japonica]|uniref:Uncharacterized protein n=1 Tax=Eumeta variegata TaxID=151549 RepID=A0A4C1VZP2_EUMVA|nr:hypothetical protein EVAR_85224_1 [Eumeta japonica]
MPDDQNTEENSSTSEFIIKPGYLQIIQSISGTDSDDEYDDADENDKNPPTDQQSTPSTSTTDYQPSSKRRKKRRDPPRLRGRAERCVRVEYLRTSFVLRPTAPRSASLASRFYPSDLTRASARAPRGRRVASPAVLRERSATAGHSRGYRNGAQFTQFLKGTRPPRPPAGVRGVLRIPSVPGPSPSPSGNIAEATATKTRSIYDSPVSWRTPSQPTTASQGRWRLEKLKRQLPRRENNISDEADVTAPPPHSAARNHRLYLVLVSGTAEANDKATKAAFFKIRGAYAPSGVKAEQPANAPYPGSVITASPTGIRPATAFIQRVAAPPPEKAAPPCARARRLGHLSAQAAADRNARPPQKYLNIRSRRSEQLMSVITVIDTSELTILAKFRTAANPTEKLICLIEHASLVEAIKINFNPINQITLSHPIPAGTPS